MFKISRRLDCAVQLLTLLAGSEANTPQTASSLAGQLNYPLAFLYQINNRLVRLGFIRAIPGPGGGLRLHRPAELISLLDVFIAIEGPAAFTVEDGYARAKENSSTIAAHAAWNKMHAVLTDHLKAISIADLAK